MSSIGRFEHMVKRPRANEAGELLLKIASLVKPIMKSHGWKVGTLAEFVPDNPGLLGLNVNGGQKILLRLRPARKLDTFYDLEQLVLVMLHELTHNVHGPHDGKFYKLLEQLEEEYYDLKRKGYTGDGFHSDGARLGGSHVPEHIGKIKALEAAETRRKKLVLMSGGGKLGGAGTTKGKTMREVLAEAAERRMKDDKSCIHEDAPSAEEEARKAAAESEGVDAVDLPISLDAPSTGMSTSSSTGVEEQLAKQRDPGLFPPPLQDTAAEAVSSSIDRTKSRPSKPQSMSKTGSTENVAPAKKKPRLVAEPPTSLPTDPNLHPDRTWSCPTCTLINEPLSLACDVCGGPKPRDESRGWWCDVCLEFGNVHDRWMCQSCGSIKRRG